MADKKFSDEIKKELKGFNETIDKNTKQFSKSMSNVINKMAEVNAPLAAQLSDVRAAGKDSFAAALQTKKAVDLTSRLNEVQASNLIVSNKELGELNEIFKKYGAENFDVKSFSTIQAKMAQTAEELETLENERQAEIDRRYKSSNKLGKMQAIIDKANADMLADQNSKGAVYKNALALRDKTQQNLDTAHKAMFEKEDEAIEAKKKQYEEEKATADELNGIVKDVSSALQEDAGRFGQFSDGIKELTGIDIQGMADSVVTSINAVGKVFGKEQLFAGVMDSVISSVGGMMGSVADNFSGLGKALAPVGAAMTGGIASFTKGGLTLGGVFSSIGTAMSITAKGLMASGAMFLKGLGGVIKQMLIAGGKFLLTIPLLIANSLIFIGGLMITIAGLLISALPFIVVGLAIVGAIGLVVAAFNHLYENVEWFRNSIDWLVDAFWGVYEFLKDFISGNVFGSIKTYVSDIFGGIMDFFGGVVDFVKAALSGDMGGMWDAVKSIFGAIKDLFLAPFKFVKNLILGEDPEGLDEAQESGLYDLDRIGNSEINEDKVKNAPMNQLKAIVAHDDLNEEDMAMIKEEIARQEAVNLSMQEPSTGQEISDKSVDAEKEKAVGSTMNNVVTDASSNTSNTNNVIHSSGSAKDTSNASRLAAQSY